MESGRTATHCIEAGPATGVDAGVLCGQVMFIATSTTPCINRVAAAQGQKAGGGNAPCVFAFAAQARRPAPEVLC